MAQRGVMPRLQTWAHEVANPGPRVGEARAGGASMGLRETCTDVYFYRVAGRLRRSRGVLRFGVMPLHVYPSIRESGVVPVGWTPSRNQVVKYPVRNDTLRRYLRTLRPGRWQKVIKLGFQGEVHYFEHESGWVAGVKFFPSR